MSGARITMDEMRTNNSPLCLMYICFLFLSPFLFSRFEMGFSFFLFFFLTAPRRIYGVLDRYSTPLPEKQRLDSFRMKR
jgi:hypothetical protein